MSSEQFTVEVFENRTEYRLNGKLHSLGSLRALEYKDGTKYWHLNGEIHRNQDPSLPNFGPAIEYPNGNKCWYLNGKCHRNQDPNLPNYGPAVEYSDGHKSWYLNGENTDEPKPIVKQIIEKTNTKDKLQSLLKELHLLIDRLD
jgi:hypothetical protein